jgi:phage gp29-like protein
MARKASLGGKANGNGGVAATVADRRVSAADGKLMGAAINGGSIIHIASNDRTLFQLWGELTPGQLTSILKQAVIGSLVWQERLFQKMCDEWPRLQKNLLTLKRDVAGLPWSVSPYTDKGTKPSQSALDKAELVERALFGMVSDPTQQQRGFNGMIKDIVNAVPCGISISEIYWTRRDGEIVPQCSRKIPARFYGYPINPLSLDQLLLNPLGNLSLATSDLEPFPDNKFLIGVFQGYDNHPTMAAILRSLTSWWLASKYGLKWFMTFCQMFGMPFRFAEYEPGDNATQAELANMLERMGFAGWGVFPAGSKVSLIEAKGVAGTTIPQYVLQEAADIQCDIAILGQTLTSSSRGSGGSRALGQVHADTEREVLNGVADFVKEVINTQLIPAIIELNYGEPSELPTLDGSMEEPQDELVLAQRDYILFNQMGLPVAKDFLYDRHSIPQPGEDDELYEPGGSAPSAPDGASSLEGPNVDLNPAPEPKASDPGVMAKQSKRLQPSPQMLLAVKRGLALRAKVGQGGSYMAIARARDIAAGKPLAIKTVKRMQLFFDSHTEAANADPESAEGIAYLLHGGDAGKLWVSHNLKLVAASLDAILTI